VYSDGMLGRRRHSGEWADMNVQRNGGGGWCSYMHVDMFVNGSKNIK